MIVEYIETIVAQPVSGESTMSVNRKSSFTAECYFVLVACIVSAVLSVVINLFSVVPDTRPSFSTSACSDVQLAYLDAHPITSADGTRAWANEMTATNAAIRKLCK